GHPGTDGRDAGADECDRAIRIVHVTGAMQSAEEHTQLRDHAEQRIVAPRAAMLGVEADCGALGVALRAEHRAVEIDCDPSETLCLDALEGHVTHEFGQAGYFARAGLCEGPR